MRYKEGDIVRVIKTDSWNNDLEKYKYILFKVDTLDSTHLSLEVSSLTNEYGSNSNINAWANSGGTYNIPKGYCELATKEDLRAYLDFIFTDEKVWFKFNNTSDGNLIAKVINKKYPYSKLILKEDYKNHDRFYFNRKQLYQNINEEHMLNKGYYIIKIEDIKYMIKKIYGK